MRKSEEISQEIKLIDNRILTYEHYLHLRNTGQIEVTDRITQIDFPKMEKKALETYREILLTHWSLEYKKEQEGKDE